MRRRDRAGAGRRRRSRRPHAEFTASGTVITHQGFRRVYVEETDDDDASEGNERRLPPLAGRRSRRRRSRIEGHETQPPSRYTEASLVKRLEELGVGRPSTYASIIGTIQDRGYVWKKGSALVPSFTAFSVVGLLENHFPNLVDYAFTARMEDDLDTIASGSRRGDPVAARVLLRCAGRAGPEDRRSPSGWPRSMPAPSTRSRSGSTATARSSSPGSASTARTSSAARTRPSIPDDIPPDELTLEQAIEFLEAPKGDRELGVHPETGLAIFAKAGRFGPYRPDGRPRRRDRREAEDRVVVHGR